MEAPEILDCGDCRLRTWHDTLEHECDSVLTSGFHHGPLATTTGPFLGIYWICGPEWRRYLRQELSARGVPICMQCGYDLTGNEWGVCSECGQPVKQA